MSLSQSSQDRQPLAGDSRFEAVDLGSGTLLRTRVAFTPGSLLVVFGIAALQAHPERYTIQIGESSHILPNPDFVRFLNHSCAPNVFVDALEMSVKAISPIEAGDILTYFYPSTEWSMKEPFVCDCGAPQCIGLIEGAAHLSADVISRYRFCHHIQTLLRIRAKSPGAQITAPAPSAHV